MDLEKIYNNSPVLWQNLFCSLYGLKIYRGRYSPPFSDFFNALLDSQYLDRNAIEILQTKKLITLLKTAKRDTAYYAPTLPDIPASQSLGLKDILCNLPVLDKEQFRESPESFLSTRYDRRKLVKVNTSGTTGAPMTIYMTPEARKMNYAFFTRSKRWAGIGGFERSITFAGRLIVPKRQESPPFWRANRFYNNRIYSSYHISDVNLPSYIESIKAYSPFFIDAYPSSLYPVADYILRQGITGIRPKAIITSSETLLEHQRLAIEKAFGCKVFDQYGSAEQAVFACQCEHGAYHLNPEYGVLEVVDKNNKPVPDGELGEFVCTGFTNDAMPLIRYKIGDLGALSKEKCQCGRHFQVIEKIVGRMDDVLTTPEGTYVGRLDPVFKGMGNTVKETQIIQQATDLIDVILVRGSGYKEDDGLSITRELKKRMGEQVTISIHYVNEIPRCANGKFRAVINNISAH